MDQKLTPSSQAFGEQIGHLKKNQMSRYSTELHGLLAIAQNLWGRFGNHQQSFEIQLCIYELCDLGDIILLLQAQFYHL